MRSGVLIRYDAIVCNCDGIASSSEVVNCVKWKRKSENRNENEKKWTKFSPVLVAGDELWLGRFPFLFSVEFRVQ
jgi:hypothetical protein